MKVLWIALVWPETTSSAAGVRTTQLLQALKNNGFEVEVSSPCRLNEHEEKLRDLGFKTASFKPNDSSFDEYIKNLNPEIVFFDRFMAEEQFGWRVREQAPEALRVLDTIDLHSLRRARQKELKAYGSKLPLELSAKNMLSDDTVRELSSIYRSDLSFIISDYELSLLTDYYNVPANLLELNRFSYAARGDLKGFEERKNFVAIGNFNHEPNADSYRLLQKTIWPEIRKRLPEAELHIYGAYPSEEIKNLNNPKSGFLVKGWTEDSLETLSNYRVNLAPLRFGAGIKGKVSDGWTVGTPCIGTSIAKEGMIGNLDFGGSIADDWSEFSEKAVTLYGDEVLWIKAQEKGLKVIKQLYNPEENIKSVLDAIQIAITNKESKRLKNFVGSMLWHNQHRSTEYFSRWIEAKNRASLVL
jgi:glycosyltransferase involved in cell wall biosynthesis